LASIVFNLGGGEKLIVVTILFQFSDERGGLLKAGIPAMAAIVSRAGSGSSRLRRGMKGDAALREEV
jgi:hypothetical protein